MGMEITVSRLPDGLSARALIAALKAANFPSSVMMVDGQLVMPSAELAANWRDMRLKTPGGTVTVARRDGKIGIVVFGNADAALVEAQRRVAEAIEHLEPR